MKIFKKDLNKSKIKKYLLIIFEKKKIKKNFIKNEEQVEKGTKKIITIIKLNDLTSF